MSQLAEHLSTQNPHWLSRPVDTGVPRERYLKKIRGYLATEEIIVLNGVRRSGKTTLLQQTIQDRIDQGSDPKSILFVNCDEPPVQRLADPLAEILEVYQREIYGGDQITLIFDEIQAVPGWEKWIKAWYDRKNYQILLSGSSAKLLDSGLSSKISGRYLKVPVYPLDFTEYLQFHQKSVPHGVIEQAAGKYEILAELRQYLQYGGFPAPTRIPDEQIRTEHLSTYFDSILFRDIEEQNDIRNTSVLRKLLVYAVTNISVPYSYRKLSRMFGVDSRIIADYLAFAEDAFLLFEIQNFSYSLKSQNISNKKLYAIDSGLRNAVAFRFSADEGRLAENVVYIHLRRNGYNPYFWKGTGEVDFVVKHRDGALSAINVCLTDDIPEREVRGLAEFSETFGNAVQTKMIITRDLEKEERGIFYVPLWKWLLGEIVLPGPV